MRHAPGRQQEQALELPESEGLRNVLRKRRKCSGLTFELPLEIRRFGHLDHDIAGWLLEYLEDKASADIDVAYERPPAGQAMFTKEAVYRVNHFWRTR
jgi:hypothetical protein